MTLFRRIKHLQAWLFASVTCSLQASASSVQLGPVTDITFGLAELEFAFPMDVDRDGRLDVVLVTEEGGDRCSSMPQEARSRRPRP